MRIDLMFSRKAADESTYAFSELNKESFYSGSKTTLLDPFDYGDHKFEVRDAESGTLVLFSYTYCTLLRGGKPPLRPKLEDELQPCAPFSLAKSAVVVEIFDRSGKEISIGLERSVRPFLYLCRSL